MTDLVKEALATRLIAKHDHVCGGCAEYVTVQENIYLVIICRLVVDYIAVQPVVQHRALLAHDTDFLYRPYFFHSDCWEDIAESIKKLNADVPSCTTTQEVLGYQTCYLCESHIVPGKVCGVVYDGELALADRAPNNEWSLDFHAVPQFKHTCARCLTDVNQGSSASGIWGEEVEIEEL